MSKNDKKIVKNLDEGAITEKIIIAFVIVIALCVAGLIFSLPS